MLSLVIGPLAFGGERSRLRKMKMLVYIAIGTVGSIGTWKMIAFCPAHRITKASQ